MIGIGSQSSDSIEGNLLQRSEIFVVIKVVDEIKFCSLGLEAGKVRCRYKAQSGCLTSNSATGCFNSCL